MRNLNLREVQEVNGGNDPSCSTLGSNAQATITADGVAVGVVTGLAIGGPVGGAVGALIGALGALVGNVVGNEIEDACNAATSGN